MGCGSSSLKGDPPTGLGGDADAPQPVRKVRTNFSTVDYDQDSSANKKRRMTEYAPEDTIRNMSQTSGGGPPARGSTEGPGGRPGVGGDGEKLELEPYQTLDNTTKDRDLSDIAGASYPHENPRLSSTQERAVTNGDETSGVDPTSSEAKDRFAAANDPAKQAGGEGGLAPPTSGEEGEKKRKGSWLERMKDRREEISDEDMVKYTGKSKEEMKKYMETGPGVGARQGAGETGVANWAPNGSGA